MLARVCASGRPEIREIRASHKRELDRLIATFERRRAEVHGPRVAASLRVAGVDTFALASARGTSTSYDASKENRRAHRRDFEREGASAAEKEKDFFAYLEAFQRGTGELRKRAKALGFGDDQIDDALDEDDPKAALVALLDETPPLPAASQSLSSGDGPAEQQKLIGADAAALHEGPVGCPICCEPRPRQHFYGGGDGGR